MNVAPGWLWLLFLLGIMLMGIDAILGIKMKLWLIRHKLTLYICNKETGECDEIL